MGVAVAKWAGLFCCFVVVLLCVVVWVRYTFIQIAKKTYLKTLSSENTFIQKHFHPKTR